MSYPEEFQHIGVFVDKFHGGKEHLDGRMISELQASPDESREFLQHVTEALHHERLQFRGNLEGFFRGAAPSHCTRVFLHGVVDSSDPIPEQSRFMRWCFSRIFRRNAGARSVPKE